MLNQICEQIVAGDIKDTDIKLTKAILRKEYKSDEYTLDLTYTLDSPMMIKELHIPRVVIPLNTNFIKINRYDDFQHDDFQSCHITQDYFVDLGFGEMRLSPDVNGAAFTIKTVKEKTKEMTLEEIEKKLGHKVKIVNKKD